MVPGLVEPIFLLMYSWRGPEKPVFNLPSRLVAPPKSFLQKGQSPDFTGLEGACCGARCDSEVGEAISFQSTIEGLGCKLCQEISNLRSLMVFRYVFVNGISVPRKKSPQEYRAFRQF